MTPLSVFVTTLDNARTLEACLASVAWADEIVVLDSGSTDATLDIAQRFGARIAQQPFLGYGRQKQRALELTAHRWVLLLDADEMLSSDAQAEIRALLAAVPKAAGYTLPRHEQLFWRMSHPRVRHNRFLRLFDKTRGAIDDLPVHAAPRVDGPVERLRGAFYHFGETSIRTKVAKVTAYAAGMVAGKRARHGAARPWMMLVYPPFAFFRAYVLKRQYLDGWAGFIAAVVMAFYAFLKHAQWLEAERFEGEPGRRMPAGAPPVVPPPREPV
ncbi:MAG TPA: glycosyltransferase family 2 protein [Xanthomonadaceae bacterium]|jgi:glycosyltransferase involved in cell wall biosynthesis|nr:glycosyltransferase family 2 protein [Xanthomonadaceae bacterium]